MVNNYYKYGPSTSNNAKGKTVNPYKKPPIPFGKFYINGNYVDGNPEVTNNNWLGVVMNQGTDADAQQAKVSVAFSAEPITTQNAADAYSLVLKSVGATLPKRDTLDERIINDVKNRTGKMIDVQGDYPHGTDYSLTVNSWPALKSAPAPTDTDKDGMPDKWEKENGLNMNDAKDAAVYKLDKSYTNVEVYLNRMVK